MEFLRSLCGDRAFGVTEYKTVAAAIKRFETSLPGNAEKRKRVNVCLAELQNVEMRPYAPRAESLV